jgi:plastocyanin
MKRLIVILTVAVAATSTTHGGTIVGTVRAQGKEGADADAAGGKYESRKFKFAERMDYGDMHDFVVYIDQPLAEKPVPPANPVQLVVQKNASFSPHLLPLLVGTTVEWPNRDEIYHNAFSISDAKQFDLGMYKDQDQVKPPHLVFDKPGRIDVFCSIHKDMHCVILVLENPYFASTDAKGHYQIVNVPAGTYKLRAWHERMPSLVKEVIVPAEGEIRIDFTLGITGLPQY